MQAVAYAEGHNFKVAAWDWWHYSEKVRKEKYDLDVFSQATELIIASEEDDLELPIIQVKMNNSHHISV